MQDARIRLGLIGCGAMADLHVSRFNHLSNCISLVAAVDTELTRAQTLANYFPQIKIAEDYHDILNEVDAVLISLPHHLHHSVGMACLNAGKHVLMEKPLANSESECLDLIHASNRNQKTLMVAYCMRFHPQVLKLKELIDSKKYGDVFQLSIWTEQHTQYPPGHWGTRASTLGGGQFFSHGCHYIDILQWFLGRPLRGTHLGTNYGTPWMEREGTSNVSIEFAGGPLGYHFGTWGAKGTRLGYSFHAHCTEGMLEADITNGKLYAHTEKGTELLLDTEKGSKYTYLELEHFADCIRSGSNPLTNAPHSLQGLRTIWRLYHAEKNNVVADLRGLGFDQVDTDGNLISMQ